jgi:hypothetical protein
MKYISKAVGALTKAGIKPQPVPADYIRSLEVSVQGVLPREYSVILEKFGPFMVPGEPMVELYDPAIICAYVASIYNMEGVQPHKWVALPIGRFGEYGDDIGYLREGDHFASSIVVLNHEGPWSADNSNWYEITSESLTKFISESLHYQE